MAREVRLACTQGVLLSLERAQRMAWSLAEVFELSSEEAQPCSRSRCPLSPRFSTHDCHSGKRVLRHVTRPHRPCSVSAMVVLFGRIRDAYSRLAFGGPGEDTGIGCLVSGRVRKGN